MYRCPANCLLGFTLDEWRDCLVLLERVVCPPSFVKPVEHGRRVPLPAPPVLVRELVEGIKGGPKPHRVRRTVCTGIRIAPAITATVLAPELVELIKGTEPRRVRRTVCTCIRCIS